MSFGAAAAEADELDDDDEADDDDMTAGQGHCQPGAQVQLSWNVRVRRARGCALKVDGGVPVRAARARRRSKLSDAQR